ncbi:MAG TPA: hypothetical protein VHW25_13825 [Steroidobacteraceae bacterium]|jgi:hypothetical protein|nr:hypothetical protein [Steroidobacteraceae bacterium]
MSTIQRFRSARRSAGTLALVSLVAALCALPASAGPNEQAKRIFDRIAGVPPSATELTQMAGFIQGGDPASAANIALQAPQFYNTTLKNFAMPWTNRDQTVFAPLNDYVATFIGMVRDDADFSTALSADILYMSNAPGLPAPSTSGNDHYAQAEAQGVDLKSTLTLVTQSGVYGTPTAATAGLMTTRASASSFFINGTNRAMFRFTLIAHLCNDMETVEDITRPPDRIRQDVSRSPGGDSRVFLNSCIGCHSGMDPMAQAFAYYDFPGTAVGDGLNTGAMVYTAGTTQAKYHINTGNFPQGFVTPDDSWSNRWRQGPNQVLGWDPTLPGSGNGAKSLGTELAHSAAFAQCQAQKVFQAVCYRAPSSQADLNQVSSMTSTFKSGGYKYKSLFSSAAVYCMGS